MKVLLLALFVVAVTASPLPEDNGSDAVQMIVNGVEEGQALEVGHIVDIKVNEQVDGEVVSATDLLHPYTAVGIAEAAAAAAAAAQPEPVVLPSPAKPEISEESVVAPVVLPSPELPEVVVPVPEAIVLPAPAVPEVVAPAPEAVVLPSPAVPEVVAPVPEAVVLPSPAVPEVVAPTPEAVVLPSPAVPEVVAPTPEAVVLPSPAVPEVVELLPNPAPQYSEDDLYNDGIVQVQYNGPQEPGVLSTLQSWVNMVFNYFSADGAQTSHTIV